MTDTELRELIEARAEIERLRDIAKMATPDQHRMQNEALIAERDALREALRQIDVIVRKPGRWDHDGIEIKRIVDRAIASLKETSR